MASMSELIREYATILDQEQQLSERKDRLRSAIVEEMKRTGVKYSSTESGSLRVVSVKPVKGEVAYVTKWGDSAFRR